MSRPERLDRVTYELTEIVRERKLTTLFQPLVDPRTRTVSGYEALTRGPSDSWLHAPQHLFEAARRCDLRMELEFLCAELAARRFVQSKAAGSLFLNISPDCIYAEPRFASRFLALIGAAGLAANRCIVELTEDGLLDDYAMLRPALQQLRDAGCDIAIDDLGAGSSGLRIWSELRPEYVKIDRYFVSGVDSDAAKLSFVRSIVDLARSIGCRVVAEGVETQAECRELMELGIDRLQGYLFGRPAAVPEAHIEEFARLESDTLSQSALSAEDLAVDRPAIVPTMPIPELIELFRKGTAHDMLAVVQDSRPVGVVRRHELFALLSKPLHFEIYCRKCVTAIMDTRALFIDARLRIDQVSRLVTQGSDTRWIDEFVITSAGRYRGIGQTLDLLRIITDQQIQAAKNSNPLTQLPGNGLIKDCISRLINDHRDFFVCYVDLDHFKPYNDTYGYVQGDRIILHLADLLRKAAADRLDFLGHVGGDDFVLVMRSRDWRERLSALLQNFADSISSFYPTEHHIEGRRISMERDHTLYSFPMLSVSVAVLDSTTAGCTSSEAAAQLLTEVKRRAKDRAGNSLMLRTSAGIFDLLGTAQDG